ncbi:uncharacterized protein MELLADRAFT_59733 [Melampsora larici-populina 98AG31]|uniref:Uncharacterized protein n=1 Tax=Melampsora larici-populina (strain 98AG31 / pathotype 3-4-7) TaxID=747676 RepID=F4R733_MELLP|nr:uncharacterized protein MELLADRAFT_59733 [Melampsora larici-populina 98AG31]EGG11510.1 hypothetical protein MELLADRAFT_59733 [Melampsora larici-populina 98AG31]
MAYFDPDHLCCTCVPLGCSERQFQKHGQIHTGRLFHWTNFTNHLKASDAAALSIKKVIDQPTSQSALGHSDDLATGHITGITSGINIGLTTATNRKRARSPDQTQSSSTAHGSERRPFHKIRRLESASNPQETDLSVPQTQQPLVRPAHHLESSNES